MRKSTLVLCLTFALTDKIQAQNFYDKALVQTVEVFFSQNNWDVLMDNLAQTTEDYLLADSVRVNGQTFDSVGVKYKGNSSYNPNNNKNPLHINLDWVHSNQAYQGYTEIKLQNGYSDPSMMREVLSYAILEKYMDCPKANFANVYINGSLRGLYSNAEDIGDKFNTDHYYGETGSFFKCNPSGGAGPGTSISPDLKYINADTVSYYNGYELKSTYGWTHLLDLINTLSNDFANIENSLDLDRAFWMLAFNNVLVNLDSYSGAFRQNYYLYRDLNDRFVPTVWDLNMSFNGFPGGTGSGSGGSTLDPLSNISSNNHPLIKYLLSNSFYKRMYMAHVRTILQEIFSNQWYLNEANTLMSTINSYVQADPYKFYTYNQFLNSLTTAASGGGPGGGASIPGIQTLMSARVSYFNTNVNYNFVAPTIQNQASSVLNPTYNSSFYITAAVSNEMTVYLGYRTNHQLRFTRVLMFDDGVHGDGLAGDHVWGAQVTASGSVFEYYIYADNTEAGLFSPQRAEHEFHALALNIPAPSSGQIQINEVMSDNNTTQDDPYGESNDWIELHNTTSQALDLSGLHLSDDGANLLKWPFPSQTILLPNAYLIIWADKDTLQTTGLHANFKLSSTGDFLALSHSGVSIENLSIPALSQDVAFARCPETGVLFDLAAPTFAAMNNCVAGLNELEIQLDVYPNPFGDELFVSFKNPENGNLSISDLQGRVVVQWDNIHQNQKISTTDWHSGIYVISFRSESGSISATKVIKF